MSQQTTPYNVTNAKDYVRQYSRIPLDMSIPHHREWAAEDMATKLGFYHKSGTEEEKEHVGKMEYLSTLAISLRDGGMRDVGSDIVSIFNCSKSQRDILEQTTGVNPLEEVMKNASIEGSYCMKECRE